MEKGLVSVVVVSFNRKDDILECLESVKGQTYKKLQTIVVDNHSTDGSIKLIREKHPEVELIVMPDAKYGACETFNIGFATAKGEYVAILDDDAVLPRDWVSRMVRRFGKEPKETAVLASKIITPSGLMWPSKEKEGTEFKAGSFVGAAAMARKEALDRTRYYAEEYFIWCNEEELTAQLLAKGYSVKYFPGVQAFHKGEPSKRMSFKRARIIARNLYWTTWMHDPLHLIPGRTLKNAARSLLKERMPLALLAGTFEALLGLPRCLKYREVVSSPYWDVKK